MNGHDSHVTLEAIEKAHEFGLYMVTFPTHTFHILQPISVPCFKPFKITFRKERNVTMSKSNYMELDKITLARWVDQALDKSITKQNIKSGFKVTVIHPLNLRAMDSKIKPSNIYTMVTIEHEGMKRNQMNNLKE
jgi:hypothetical protein